MRTKNRSFTIIIILIILLILYLYYLIPSVISWGHSSNYENVSVRTTVNITQAYPEILNITCNNGTDIALTGGGTKAVSCLVEIRDYNGGNTINVTNGTFYYYLNRSSDPDDNNTHYTNSSCTENNTNSYYTNWTCVFGLLYYANNGSWVVNLSVKDDYNLTANDTSNAVVDPLYAINVTPVINFGNMAVGDTSTTSQQANITNYGNMNINVSVFGFGGNDEVTGAGYAMLCDFRNINLPNERYSINASAVYNSMTPITDGVPTPPLVGGLVVVQQTDDVQKQINTSYWRLHVNITSNPFGQCNGTVVFAAEVP